MADTWVGINRFWASFGWPVYDDQTAFDKGTLSAYPHITYESGDGTFGHATFLTAHLWDRSPDWERLKKKAAEIKARLKDGGVKVNVDDGQLWIKAPEDMTLSQPIASGSDDEMVKRILVNVEVEFLTI